MENKREVIVADTAGFCFGVNRACNVLDEQIEDCKSSGIPVYTLGPIIHNEQVVQNYEKKGVIMVVDIKDLSKKPAGKVVIRSHGVEKKVYDKINTLGFDIIDATCPFVKKIHNIVFEESRKGKEIFIIGDKSHPEVCGIVGWCCKAPVVIFDATDIEKCNIDSEKESIVVSQTTFNNNKFKDLVELLRKKYYNIRVYETICNATAVRQSEAARVASEVDAMIVIGGISSSNTQKLYEICKKECKNTYYIQTLVDLDLTAIESAKRVGITAGASTPNYIIKEVHDACQN